MNNRIEKVILYIIPLIFAWFLYRIFDTMFSGTFPFTLINGLIGGTTAIYTQFFFSEFTIWLDKETDTALRKRSPYIFYLIVSIPCLIISLSVIILSYTMILVVFNIIYPADPGLTPSITLFGAFLGGLAGIPLGLINHLDNRTDND